MRSRLQAYISNFWSGPNRTLPTRRGYSNNTHLGLRHYSTLLILYCTCGRAPAASGTNEHRVREVKSPLFEGEGPSRLPISQRNNRTVGAPHGRRTRHTVGTRHTPQVTSDKSGARTAAWPPHLLPVRHYSDTAVRPDHGPDQAIQTSARTGAVVRGPLLPVSQGMAHVTSYHFMRPLGLIVG